MSDKPIKASALQTKTLYKGQEWSLTVKSAYKKVNWSTSNKQVLAIKKVKGKKKSTCIFKAKKKGTAKVTIKIGRTKKVIKVKVKKSNAKTTKKKIDITEDTKDVTIKKPTTQVKSTTQTKTTTQDPPNTTVTSGILTVSEKNVTVEAKKSKVITLKISTKDLADKGLTTSSTNTWICTQTKNLVSNKDGVCTYNLTINGVGAGTAQIKLTCGNLTEVVNVTVTGGQVTTQAPPTTQKPETTQAPTTTQKPATTQAPTTDAYLTVNPTNIDVTQNTGNVTGIIVVKIPYSYAKQYIGSDKTIKAIRSNTTVISSLAFANNGEPKKNDDELTYTLNYTINTNVINAAFAMTPYINVTCGDLSAKTTITFKTSSSETTQAPTTETDNTKYMKITKSISGGTVGGTDYILIESKGLSSAPFGSSSNINVCKFGSASIESFDNKTGVVVHKITVNYNSKGTAVVTIKCTDGYEQTMNVAVN